MNDTNFAHLTRLVLLVAAGAALLSLGGCAFPRC